MRLIEDHPAISELVFAEILLFADLHIEVLVRLRVRLFEGTLASG